MVSLLTTFDNIFSTLDPEKFELLQKMQQLKQKGKENLEKVLKLIFPTMKFRFYIGGYAAGHFEVLLREDNLCFFVSHYSADTDPDYVIPIKNDKGWHSHVEYMKTLNWKAKYFDNNILDGEQWELVFEHEEKKLHCFGSNEYPADFDEFIQRLSLITRKYKIPFDR